jgi:hypothetical protein
MTYGVTAASPKANRSPARSALSKKGAAPTRDDRGLAPSDELLKRKLKTYNSSHQQVGPANYQADKYNTIASRYGKK